MFAQFEVFVFWLFPVDFLMLAMCMMYHHRWSVLWVWFHVAY